MKSEIPKDDSCKNKEGKCSKSGGKDGLEDKKKDSCCKSGTCKKSGVEKIDLEDVDVSVHIALDENFKNMGSCCKTDTNECCGGSEFCTECTKNCKGITVVIKKSCKKSCCDDKDEEKPKKEEKKVYTKTELKKWGMIALALAFFTIFYNIGEGCVALYYGWEEESISLLGFGSDSFTEVFSAIIVFI